MATKSGLGVSVRLPTWAPPAQAAVTGTTRTFYCNDPIQSGSSAGLLDTAVPPAGTSVTGWTMGTTVAARYSRQSYNAEIAATGFTATLQPDAGPPITVNGHKAEDCWRLSSTTSGVFSQGTWYSSLSVIAVTNASGQVGRARFRIWRSSNADGSNATELTDPSRPMWGSSSGALSTTVATSSIASAALPAVVLANEYLFLQTAWEITTAASNVGADAVIRFGAMSSADGSGLITSAFSATQLAAPGGSSSGVGYVLRRRRDALVGAWDTEEL